MTSEPEPLLEAVHRTFLKLVDPLNDSAGRFHGYTPTPVAMLSQALEAAAPVARGKRFLDIGCGMGINLALTHHMGFTVSGFDREPRYVDAARLLVPEAHIWCADVLDVERFDADIVLMAPLARDDQTQREIDRHLVAGCSPGTVLFLPGVLPPAGTTYLDGYVSVVD